MDKKQNEILKKIWKNAGFIGLSVIVIYTLSGGSWNIKTAFINTDIIGKFFYVLFGVLILYNLAMIGGAVAQIIKVGKEPLQEVSGNAAPMVPQPVHAEQSAFANFGGEFSDDWQNSSKDSMVAFLKTKVDQFSQRLNLDVGGLEQQYKEMEELRVTINKEVGDLYKEYQKLEQQMYMMSGMIRTKKIMDDRAKQMPRI